MKSFRETRRHIVALLGLALAFACVRPAHAANYASEGERKSIESIIALIGDGACDNDAQCKTIAIGAKACGGPEYYLAWSTKRTDVAALRQAAQSELTARRNMNVNPGMRSTCVFVADPGAYCAPAVDQQRDATRTQNRACRLRAVDRGGGRVD